MNLTNNEKIIASALCGILIAMLWMGVNVVRLKGLVGWLLGE